MPQRARVELAPREFSNEALGGGRRLERSEHCARVHDPKVQRRREVARSAQIWSVTPLPVGGEVVLDEVREPLACEAARWDRVLLEQPSRLEVTSEPSQRGWLTAWQRRRRRCHGPPATEERPKDSVGPSFRPSERRRVDDVGRVEQRQRDPSGGERGACLIDSTADAGGDGPVRRHLRRSSTREHGGKLLAVRQLDEGEPPTEPRIELDEGTEQPPASCVAEAAHEDRIEGEERGVAVTKP